MSSIRVNPYPMPDLLAALEHLQQQQNTDTLELATGTKINQPSDDPAGAAQLVQINDSLGQTDSFQRSIASISDQFSTANSILSSVVSAVQRAISLGVEGANGTLSQDDRDNVAAEVSGIQSQLISLANTSYQGQYLFAGTTNLQPYIADPNSPSGVTYQGNTGTNQVTIGNGYQIQVNLPGSQLFNAPGSDMFQAVNDLITGLKNDSGIDTAVSELNAAYTYLTGQQVFYGNAINQVQDQQTYLSSAQVSLEQQQNTVAAADIAGTATQLASAQTAENATLSAIGRSPQSSLFDYLPL